MLRTRFTETFEVDVPEEATLLDVLDVVKDEVDGSLTYRKSCRMAGRNMRDLMCHQGRKLCLAVNLRNQSPIDVQKTARQRKNSAAGRVDHFDSERHLRIGMPDQILRQPSHVAVYFGITNVSCPAVNRQCHRRAQRALFFERIQIDAVSNIPLPDSIDIVLLRWRTDVP